MPMRSLQCSDDSQMAGSYLYEAGGSVHTLGVLTDAAEGFMVVYGANINCIYGDFIGIRDAGNVLKYLSCSDWAPKLII